MKHNIAQNKQLFNVNAIADSKTLDLLADGEFGVYAEGSDTSMAAAKLALKNAIESKDVEAQIAAQQQLLAGQPQYMNAILGNQVDMSAMNPFQAQPIDWGFTNQQLPQVQPLQTMGPTAPGGDGQGTMTPTDPTWQFQNLFGGGQ